MKLVEKSGLGRVKYSYFWQVRLLLLPYVLGIAGLVLLPAVGAFGLAFFQYDALSPPRWVGMLNFSLAYTDELFVLSVQNSLALILLPVPLRVAGAFLLARLLQRPGRGVNWWRTAVFVPSVMPAAAYALAWLWILNPLYGPLNNLLRAFGLYDPAWLADPLWAKPGLVLMSLWLIGEGFLVCLAALQDIPPAVDEAATMDGANSVTRFAYITLPLLAPILLLLLLRDAILTFQNSFTAVVLMTQGNPYYATYTLPLFIYEKGFDQLAFGTASAALWVMYGLTGFIVIAIYVIARQWNVGTTEDTFVL